MQRRRPTLKRSLGLTDAEQANTHPFTLALGHIKKNEKTKEEKKEKQIDLPKKHIFIRPKALHYVHGYVDPPDDMDDVDEILSEFRRIKSLQRAQSVQLKLNTLNII